MFAVFSVRVVLLAEVFDVVGSFNKIRTVLGDALFNGKDWKDGVHSPVEKSLGATKYKETFQQHVSWVHP